MDTRTDTERRADLHAAERAALDTFRATQQRADDATLARDDASDALTAAARAHDDARDAHESAVNDWARAGRERRAALNAWDDARAALAFHNA